jgi:hypothetical protein
VAVAFSAGGLLIRLPILYYIAGRRGPVSTSDLWSRLLRHLPLWIVMLCTTWLMRASVANVHPLMQLLICTPVGVFAGVAFICVFRPQRRIAAYLLDTLREYLKKQ